MLKILRLGAVPIQTFLGGRILVYDFTVNKRLGIRCTVGFLVCWFLKISKDAGAV